MEPTSTPRQSKKPVGELRETIRHTKLVEEFNRKPDWWREIFYIVALYGLYSLVRNVHGSVLSITTANQHAADVVSLEQKLHFFNEKQIQDFFIDNKTIIRFLDIYYGTAHFIVTVCVLLWLYHLKTDRYRHWRNVVFGTTGLALIGYMSYPLAPPRLLPSHYGFIDTLQTIGGGLSFDSKTVENVSNQYAAMPSLHVAWALWCACAVAPVLRHWPSRVAVFLYPALTITAIIVTANHYWADVAGGAAAFTISYMCAHLVDRRTRRRLIRSGSDSDPHTNTSSEPSVLDIRIGG